MPKTRIVTMSGVDENVKGIYFTKDFVADSADFLERGWFQIESDEVYEMPLPKRIEGKIYVLKE